jgi:hypothetical protein
MCKDNQLEFPNQKLNQKCFLLVRYRFHQILSRLRMIGISIFRKTQQTKMLMPKTQKKKSNSRMAHLWKNLLKKIVGTPGQARSKRKERLQSKIAKALFLTFTRCLRRRRNQPKPIKWKLLWTWSFLRIKILFKKIEMYMISNNFAKVTSFFPTI